MTDYPKYCVLRCERENSWTIGRLCTEASGEYPTYLGLADAANPEASARIVKALIASDLVQSEDLKGPKIGFGRQDSALDVAAELPE